MSSKQREDDLNGTVHQAVHIAAAAGRTLVGLGMRIASVQANPKQCALALLECGKEFQTLATACNELAAKICDIDAKSVNLVEKGGICDANGQPLRR